MFGAPKPQKPETNYSEQSKALFCHIAHELGLEISEPTYHPRAVSMFIPKQKNLKESVSLEYYGDTLQFDLVNFSCELFPFNDVQDRFEDYLKGLLTGQCRLLKFFRLADQKVFKSKLQRIESGDWQTLYTYQTFIGVQLSPSFGQEEYFLATD